MRNQKKTLMFLLLFLASQVVFSNDSGTSSAEKIFQENENKTIYGPSVIDLGDQATISIQYGEAFIPSEVVKKAMAASGAGNTEEVIGLVVPGIPGDEPPENNWGTVVLFFKKVGFVKDDDSKKWNYNKILESINKSIEKQNKISAENNKQIVEPATWVEYPEYDKINHYLHWSILRKKINSPESASVMYSAVALGREGILTSVYSAPESEYKLRNAHMKELLSSIKFKNGKQYKDFDPKTDKSANFGLSGIVAGISGTELGVFALALAIIAKVIKPLAVVVVAISSFRLFRNKQGKKLP